MQIDRILVTFDIQPLDRGLSSLVYGTFITNWGIVARNREGKAEYRPDVGHIYCFLNVDPAISVDLSYLDCSSWPLDIGHR
jgi:hypothetical protein